MVVKMRTSFTSILLASCLVSTCVSVNVSHEHRRVELGSNSVIRYQVKANHGHPEVFWGDGIFAEQPTTRNVTEIHGSLNVAAYGIGEIRAGGVEGFEVIKKMIASLTGMQPGDISGNIVDPAYPDMENTLGLLTVNYKFEVPANVSQDTLKKITNADRVDMGNYLRTEFDNHGWKTKQMGVTKFTGEISTRQESLGSAVATTSGKPMLDRLSSGVEILRFAGLKYAMVAAVGLVAVLFCVWKQPKKDGAAAASSVSAEWRVAAASSIAGRMFRGTGKPDPSAPRLNTLS